MFKYNFKARLVFKSPIFIFKYRVSHSLPNPAETWNRCSVSQQLGALQTHTTDTFLFISHTTNVLLFKFRCSIFTGVRIIKEIPVSVASGTHCISFLLHMIISLLQTSFFFVCCINNFLLTLYIHPFSSVKRAHLLIYL